MELELPLASEKVGCSRTGHVDAQPAPQSSLGGNQVESSQGAQLTERGRVRSGVLPLALSSLYVNSSSAVLGVGSLENGCSCFSPCASFILALATEIFAELSDLWDSQDTKSCFVASP